ncbi:MAG TPA: DUF2071 domain-containing protein [Pyrinomonadaceae bacterium]|nr:DUF2071 domain-containing protein [Pyrinomonadaceae bacterium]
MTLPTLDDRLRLRERPERRPLVQQSWGKLLFMHWRIDVGALRPLIPAGLEIDTFDGSAWVAVVPFTMWNTRPTSLLAVPWFSAMHELNVRTYVHFDSAPGVWFFSLDCNSALAVWGARTFYHVPYFNAAIDLVQNAGEIDYSLHRTDKPAADFHSVWNIGESLPRSEPESLEFFLTERYCLYSEHKNKLYRANIHHPPWPLQRAEVKSLQSTMLEAAGVSTPDQEPLLHYAESIDVDIWSLEKV